MGNAAPAPGKKKLSKREKKRLKKLEAQRVNNIVNEQETLIEYEINQKWTIILGDMEEPIVFNVFSRKRKPDVHVVPEITQRNIWMEDFYIYNIIKSFYPDKLFHPAEEYSLKYKPPRSLYWLVVPLTDPRIQESTLIQLAKLTPMSRSGIVFYFKPINAISPMFATPVHPASLVEFKTKNAVLQKISEFFMDGKLSIYDMEAVLSGSYESWRPALYNVLPPDWQVYHTYLTQREFSSVNEKEFAREYLEGHISIKDFENMKYPERKKLRDIQALAYPRPYEGTICCIGLCNRGVGIIKCQNCDNMACIECVKRTYNYDEGSSGSFLLLHHTYCLRMGKMRDLAPQFVYEPGYLRSFRQCTRVNMVASLIPEKVVKMIEEESESDDSEDEYEKRQQELAANRAEEEALRLARYNPEALKLFRVAFEEKQKKFLKLQKEVDDYTDKINDPSRGDAYVSRTRRLKRESVAKLMKTIDTYMNKLAFQVAGIKDIDGESLGGPFMEEMMADVEKVRETCRNIQEASTKEDQELEEKEAKEKEREREICVLHSYVGKEGLVLMISLL